MALEGNHSGVVADEVYSSLKYFISKLPGPGEDPEDTDKEKPLTGDRVGGEFKPVPKEDEEPGKPSTSGEKEPGGGEGEPKAPELPAPGGEGGEEPNPLDMLPEPPEQ